MSEDLFSAVLTFSLLAAGTAAVGSELLTPRTVAAKASAVATLPTVTVIGQRVVAAETLTLPTVVVTGRRPVATQVALDDTGSERNVQ